MKLAIVTTLWGRREVSKIVLNYYHNLTVKDIDFTLIAVSTQEEDIDLARKYGWISKWHENVPLSDKFNEGFLEAMNHDPDAVMVIGSDNLITPNYFEALPEVDYSAPGGTYFYSPELDECRYVRSPSGCGAGRVLSKKLLNSCDWRPYTEGNPQFIESAMKEKIGVPDELVDVSRESGRLVVDIKTKRWPDSTEGVNMWSYERMARSLVAQPVETGRLYEAFPDLRTLVKETV